MRERLALANPGGAPIRPLAISAHQTPQPDTVTFMVTKSLTNV